MLQHVSVLPLTVPPKRANRHGMKNYAEDDGPATPADVAQISEKLSKLTDDEFLAMCRKLVCEDAPATFDRVECVERAERLELLRSILIRSSFLVFEIEMRLERYFRQQGEPH